jgi:exonuclease VII large subunit
MPGKSKKSEDAAKYYQENKESRSAEMAEYYQENKEAINAATQKYYRKNKEALREKQKIYHLKNREAILKRQRINTLKNKEASKRYRQKKWEKQRIKGAVHRAKAKNLPFNITEEYVKSITPKDMICPALGIKMNTSVEDLDSKPSLDRLVPEKGYVKGNVIVVSFRVNRIKTDATPEELMKVAIFYEKLFDTLSKDQLTLDFVA